MIRQRRLISILLVLSILVSSGVLWGLHDTGITMANDAECGIEEHIHTDECYAEVLVCGYDDNGEKYDDTLNYQYVCACGLEEGEDHTHGPECYEFVYAKDKGQDEAEAETEGTEDEEMPVTERIVNGVSAAVIPEDEEEAEVEDEKTADTDETDEDQGTDEHKGVKHIHTENCYGRAVVCGIEEHIHRYSCYFGEVPEEEDEDFGLIDDSKVVMLNSLMDDEDEDVEFFDASEMSVGADGSNLGTVTTIDNIAEGIRFTLFDYLDLDKENPLDGTNSDGKWNSYDISNNSHPNIAYSGVNTGRDPEKDILFFAYGTPAFTGPNGNINNYKRNMITETINNKTILKINPSKNNYSGDYNYLPKPNEIDPYSSQFSAKEPVWVEVEDENGNKENKLVTVEYTDSEGNTKYYRKDYYEYAKTRMTNEPHYTAPISGNRPVQGIVNTTLDNGYPTISGSGNSLAYLFNPDLQQYQSKGVDGNTVTVNTSDVREVYRDVNHLLWKNTSDNHLVFDSDWAYAYYNKDTGNFTVYDGTFDIVNKDHHKAGERDLTNKKDYESDKLPGFKIGFFPFNDYNSANLDPNFDTKTEKYNHHFGMTMDAKFINIDNPKDANHDPNNDVVFSYSGDDDMWVFVDNKLVLDVGGIHEPTAGMIDFTNGLVWVQDNAYGYSTDEIRTQLNGWGIDLDKINKPRKFNRLTSDSPDETEYTKWVVTKEDFEKGKEYEIKMFYLERGGCYSNLAMDINLPTLKSLVVSKDVKADSSIDTLDDTDYYFRVYEEYNGNLIDANLGLDADGNNIPNTFTLKAGQRKVFENLNGSKKYQVEEYNIDTNIYSSVKINEDDEYKNTTVASKGPSTLDQVND